MPKRKQEEQKQSANKLPKTTTIHDIPQEVLPTIFGFFNTKTLGRVGQVSKLWKQQSFELLENIKENTKKVREFSALLRGIWEKQTSSTAAVAWLQNNKFIAANVACLCYEYNVGINESEKLHHPSLLHDFAQLFPKEDEKDNYVFIFNKLLEFKADPDAVCQIELITIDESENESENESEGESEGEAVDKTIILSNKGVFEYALSLVNIDFMRLWLKLYTEKKFKVENRSRLLEKTLDEFIEYHRRPANKIITEFDFQCGKIINTMLDCGFVPDIATVQKYLDEKINIYNEQNDCIDLASKLKSFYSAEALEQSNTESNISTMQL